MEPKSSTNSPPPLPVKSMTMSGPAMGRGRPPRRRTTEVPMSHLEEEVNMDFVVYVVDVRTAAGVLKPNLLTESKSI